MMRHTEPIVRILNRVQAVAIVFAVLGIVFGIIGAIIDIDHFFQIYLVAFLFWLELGLGCLALLMIPNLVPGGWNLSIQRFAAAGARTLPLMGLLFVPILLGLDRLYPWAGDDAGDLSPYLDTGFFVIRALIYFLIWVGLAFGLSILSYRSDDNQNNEGAHRQAHFLSIVGGILFFITVTFAMFDWSMTIDEDWFSTIWGWLAISRAGLGAMALVILALALFWRFEPLVRIVKDRVLGDLSALLLVALMAWSYLSVIQYVVIWSGNVSSKALWYAPRTTAGWEALAIFLIVSHAIIILLMLVPGLKKTRSVLIGLAAALLILRLIEVYWTVMPAFSSDFVLEWWDFALPFGVGGLWVLLFVWSLRGHRLLAENHPEMAVIDRQEEENYETAR